MRKSPGSGSSGGTRPAVFASLGALAVLGIWAAAAHFVDSEIVLPSPLRVARSAAVLFPTAKFLLALQATFLRGLASFGISMAAGIAVGLACGLSSPLAYAMAPALTITRATPVLAVILLALIWFPSGTVPIFAAVLMAFPVVVGDVRQGVRSADPKLLEMSRLFQLRRRDRLRSIYAPAMAPHLASAAHGALGLCWKVVVAGEVLSQPARALGTGMNRARIELETAEVFAWTLAGILLCALTDLAFKLIRRRRGGDVRPS
ncbi:MAG TPA: ABC transporter permease subunit [Holophaga sp.]|nr:ABC transporter permease subunit [Holophaga sp.]HPS67197.1 ABC transporter permease subunit [Holophaga sp.]